MVLYEEILNDLKTELEPLKFECYPFKISWYNSHVDAKFKLDYDNDTFAVLILNTPSMFEQLFLPYIFKNFKNNESEFERLNDPIDDCLAETFEKVKMNLDDKYFNNNNEIDTIKDYEITAGTRRAKIIMQTVAHISGAAYFYDPKSIQTNPNQQALKKNLMGICLHPKYGGWFAMRCVFIFKNLLVSDDQLKITEPVDALKGDPEKIYDLIRKFNFNWKDSAFREVIKVEERYSDLQQEYFLTEPRNRKELLKKWLCYANHLKLINSYALKNQQNYLIRNFYFV